MKPRTPMTTASNAKAIPFRYNRQLHILCALVRASFWPRRRIQPIMPEDWWVENGLVFVCRGRADRHLPHGCVFSSSRTC